MYGLVSMMKNDKNTGKNGGEMSKQKERHIVTWSPEEDDILREQIRVHGTDNWTVIASKFKDKTTRQCRRRWYTYLNSDFKKGGWSPEEDMILCQAQKIFGNRWTEIAKVVSGRTDNAVKNRFSTLCKKQAKREALAKENNSFINLNNKRIIFPNGLSIGVSETSAPFKKMRTDTLNLSENHGRGKSVGECGRDNQLLRPPLALLSQNLQQGTDSLSIQQRVKETDSLVFHKPVHNLNEASIDVADNKMQRTFLTKNDPRIPALLQQAELLSSLALKVSSENTSSLENAWQVLQDYLSQTKESRVPTSKNLNSDFQIQNFKNLVSDLRSNSEDSRLSLRQPDIDITTSEYSTGSTLLSHAEFHQTEQDQVKEYNEESFKLSEVEISIPCDTSEVEISIPCDTNSAEGIFPASETMQSDEGALCQNSEPGFSSPVQVTPLFTTLASAIPSPKFSESERHFLLKTLGLESASSNPGSNTSRPPQCRRVLLHSL